MKINLKEIKQIERKISGLKVLVLGDVILDRYIDGEVERISPEAPVQIVKVVNKRNLPGGAANTAFNLSSLGAETYLIGVAGDDEYGKMMNRLLRENGIKPFLLLDKNRVTTVKTRITAMNQQLLRIDEEEVSQLNKKMEQRVIEIINSVLSKIDGIIISDYAKGFLSKGLMDFLKGLKIPLYVDPKPVNLYFYKGVTCLCPNFKEAFEMSKLFPSKKNVNVNKIAERIDKKLKPGRIIITMGEEGAFIFFNKKGKFVSTRKRKVYDVTGAGDTFISLYALCDLCGLDPYLSVYLSNIASGIVVEKYGTYSPSFNDIIRELKFEKIIKEG